MSTASVTPRWLAKPFQIQRPTMIPSGTPIMSATTTTVVAWQATVARTWRRAKPKVLRTAISRRRRRTDVTSKCESTPTLRTARSAASRSGVARTAS